MHLCSTHLPDSLCYRDPFHMRHQTGDDEEEGEEFDEAVVERGAVAMTDVHQLLEDAHGRAGTEIELKPTSPQPIKPVVVPTNFNLNCFFHFCNTIRVVVTEFNASVPTHCWSV